MNTKHDTQSDIVLKQSLDIPLEDILKRAREVQEQIERVKPLYAELDNLVLELIRRGFKHALLPDGTHAELHDNFLDKDGAPKLTAWKSCGVSHYTLDFTDEASQARALKRAAAKGVLK